MEVGRREWVAGSGEKGGGRWEWGDGGEIGVGRWEWEEGSGQKGVGRWRGTGVTRWEWADEGEEIKVRS